MTLNGKQVNFTRNDFYSFEKLSPIFSKRNIDDVLNQTIEAVSHWDKLASEQDVPSTLIKEISHNLRLSL
jgi:serine/threonine-protein kinase HipA